MSSTLPATDSASSTSKEVNAALGELIEGEKTWARTDLLKRAQLLGSVYELAVRHSQEWVDAAVRVKQLDPGSPLVGEEWISGPYPVATNAATLAQSLVQLAEGRSPLGEQQFSEAPGGRVAVNVFPGSLWDKLLLSGFSAQVWLQPGTTRAEALTKAGLAQHDPAATAGVGAVLGAGNITSIAALDTLYELIAHNRVVALKLNPIMDPMREVMAKVLAPFVDLGVVRILTGDGAVGSYLAHHHDVDHVHVTGSARTHDAIVFGIGEEGARRKSAGEPILESPISSELGGVSPTIILPDRWTSRDIGFQARQVATHRLHNGGYNCIASQIVVLPAGWSRKGEFLTALRHEIDASPSRPAYYPGSDERVADAIEAHPGAERRDNGRVLLPDLDPDAEPAALRTEYFAPVLGIVELAGDGATFLANASAFVNEKLTGTLGANVLAHPRVIARLSQAFDTFIESLRYGTIAINAWTGVGYLTSTAPWGAFPGHTLADVQSGIGAVHNALLLDQTERTVVRGPFRPFPRSVATGEWSISPTPPWCVSNRTAATTGRLLVQFAGRPAVSKLPRIFASALRG
jgi:aldehyde dehydrogenase (NAD(P)+)